MSDIRRGDFLGVEAQRDTFAAQCRAAVARTVELERELAQVKAELVTAKQARYHLWDEFVAMRAERNTALRNLEGVLDKQAVLCSACERRRQGRGLVKRCDRCEVGAAARAFLLSMRGGDDER